MLRLLKAMIAPIYVSRQRMHISVEVIPGNFPLVIGEPTLGSLGMALNPSEG